MAATVPDPEHVRLRLRIARLRAGYLTITDAASYLEANGVANQHTYRRYEEGARNVTEKVAARLEEAYKVPRAGWLWRGGGETTESLRRELAALERQGREKMRERRLPQPAPQPFEDAETSRPINQLTAKSSDFDVISSQSVPTGRIPVLLVEEIASFLAGERDDAMAGPTLPVDEDLLRGGRVFAFKIPASDESMVGASVHSFPPGTMLFIDADADIPPGKYLLVRRRDMKQWLFRRYEAGLPFSAGGEFTLRALNPAIEPVRVTDTSDWEVGGLLVAAQHRY